MNRRSTSLPKSPLNTWSFLRRARARFTQPAIALVAGVTLLAGRSAKAQNTQYNVTNGQTNLTLAATYTTGGTTATNPPTVTSDVLFNSGVAYTTPTAFVIPTNITFGSLNDLSTTAITISNSGGTAASLLTLGGTGDLGDGVTGSNAADLLFVGTGANLTITGGTTTTALGLVLGQSGNFDVNGTATISAVISGTGTGFTKTGTGTLVLSAVDTYTGATAVNGGIMTIGTAAGVGSILNSSGVTVASGASLQFTFGNFARNESAIIGGVISGAGGFIDNQGNGNSILILDKANTYTGSTTISDRGTLQASVATAYDANGNPISGSLGVNSAVVFAGPSFIANRGLTLLLSSATQIGSLSTGANTVANSIGNGVILNNNNLIIGGDNTSTTFNAQISGGAIPNSSTVALRNIGGNLTKIGTGTQTFGGANLYSGSTTINGGTLSVTTIANGGFATTGTVANASNQLTLANATGAVAGQNIQGSSLGVTAEVISSVSGNVVTLSGNAGAAGTNIPIAFGTANGLGISTNAAANLVLNGGTLQYTGAAASTDRLFTVGAGTAGATGTLDASGTGAVNFTNTGAVAYGTADQARTVGLTGTNTGANTLAPSIGNNGAGVVNLVKSGAGSWTLTNTNTYTGGTAVNAGSLFVNNTTGSGAGSGAVTVGPTATLGGTGILTVASVTVNSTGTLAPGATIGATTGALTLNTTGGTMLNGTLAITLGTTGNNGTFLNTTGGLMLGAGSVLTVTGTSGLAAYDLANYTAGTLSGTFTTLNIPSGYTVNYAGTDFGGTSIELVATAVPEPSTWMAGLACFGLLGFGLVRNRRKSSAGVKLSA